MIRTLAFTVANTSHGWLFQNGLRGSRWYEMYLNNYYTALMMVMGDSIQPTTKLERLYVSVIVLVGAAMNATIFANVASYVAQIGAKSARHKARIESIVQATRLLNIPQVYADRIRSYFDYCAPHRPLPLGRGRVERSLCVHMWMRGRVAHTRGRWTAPTKGICKTHWYTRRRCWLRMCVCAWAHEGGGSVDMAARVYSPTVTCASRACAHDRRLAPAYGLCRSRTRA